MYAIEPELASIKDYVFPFEGEKHLATIILLPYREDTWRNGAKPALAEFFSVVDAIRRFEWVIVVADPRIDSATVARFEKKNVHILRLPYDDSWARDPIPAFLLNPETKKLCGVDFGFNSWGGDFDGLYRPWDKDNALGRNILLDLMITRYAAYKDFILEGGNIHSDGEGTILTSEECQLSKGRNPSLSKEEIEQKLKDSLNAKKVLFVPKGIVNDETDGHIDNICCFLKPGVVALAYTEDKEDPQYQICQDDLAYLQSETDAKGRKLQVVLVPLPKVQYLTKEEADGIKDSEDAVSRKVGRRLAASYINFYMGEKFLLLPQFGDKESDKKALTLFSSLFPDKEVFPIASREILLGGGNIHCITHQIPYSALYWIEEQPVSKHAFFKDSEETKKPKEKEEIKVDKKADKKIDKKDVKKKPKKETGKEKKGEKE